MSATCITRIVGEASAPRGLVKPHKLHTNSGSGARFTARNECAVAMVRGNWGNPVGDDDRRGTRVNSINDTVHGRGSADYLDLPAGLDGATRGGN